MNREQAEHILDGYMLIFGNPNMEDADNALREIILDAMTEYKTQRASTYPGITLPADGTPKVTWTGNDPLTLFGTCTMGVSESKTINKIDDSVIDDRFCSLLDKYVVTEGKEK